MSLIGRGVPIRAREDQRVRDQLEESGGGRSVDVPAKDIESDVLHAHAERHRRRVTQGADALRFKASPAPISPPAELASHFDVEPTRGNAAQRPQLGCSRRRRPLLLRRWQGCLEVATKDIAVSLATKHEVVMEFHMDDTAAQASKDTLVEMSFYAPTSAEWGVEPDPEIRSHGRQAPGGCHHRRGGHRRRHREAIAEFESVSLIAPRGKVTIELHAGFMRLSGSAADFKIQYGSIQRIFLLPKPNHPQTYAVMHLDPPIRKGQTFYPHVVAVFNANEELEIEPALDDDLKARFEKLEDSYEGPSGEVFVRLLKAISGCKLTRQGTFTAADGGHAVKASNKAEVGHLFPLEKSFFYLPKPAMLAHYADVSSVEFERHSGPHAAATQRTFDVVVNMRSGVAHTFHGIPKSEFQNLVSFLTAKNLRIENVDAEARANRLIDDDESDGEDHHAARLKASARAMDEDGHGGSDSEDDEDFAAGSESDGGEPTDESESESGSGDESDGSDAPAKKKAKKSKASPAGKKGGKKKTAKKDPNAPKRPLSSYMIFAGENRAKVVEENLGASIGDVGKALGPSGRRCPPRQGAVRREGERGQGGDEKAMAAYKASKGGGRRRRRFELSVGE